MNEEAPLSVRTYALLGVLVAQLRTVFLILTGLALKIFQFIKNGEKLSLESTFSKFFIGFVLISNVYLDLSELVLPMREFAVLLEGTGIALEPGLAHDRLERVNRLGGGH